MLGGKPAHMTASTLFLVGATHRTAPFGFREKIALGVEGEAALATALRRLTSLREFVILNTCNRVEIYGVGHERTAADVTHVFCTLREVDADDFERFGFVRHGRKAVDHLLEVASGLDSQILGETEIFGQVKRAYATAQARNSAGPVLNRLFQKAFQAAKHVRTHTGVSVGQVSVANVGVDLATHVFGNVADARILLLGAGEMAEKSARAFQSRGARQLCIASRRLERAAALARSLDATTLAFEDRDARLGEFDVVVCSTSAPNAVVSLEAVRAARKARGGRPLLIIDLAMPRNVEAAVAGLENVFVYNLDDLAEVAATNRQARLNEAEAGRLALVPRAAALWTQLQLQLTTSSGASAAAHPSPLPFTAIPA